MPWPKKIAQGGEGSGRMAMKTPRKPRNSQNKRKFIQETVTMFLASRLKSQSSATITNTEFEFYVERAETLYKMIEEKL